MSFTTKTPKLSALGLLLFVPWVLHMNNAWATHENDGKNKGGASTAAREDLSAEKSARLDASDPTRVLSEERIVAGTLVFWALQNGQKPGDELLKSANIRPDQLQSFQASLKNSEKLSKADRLVLRSNFNSENLSRKMRGRQKFARFVERFQTSFPDFQDVIPEILTVWGEARDVGGFLDEDINVQQAKMASIIHVLRNRTRHARQVSGNNEKRKNLSPHQLKWLVALQRYQFSAFEPYDPNLAELALGPKGAVNLNSPGGLPPLDQKALINLASVIVRMNKHEIELLAPLGDISVLHYLSPALMSYDSKLESSLRLRYKRVARKHALRLPAQNPQYLTIVPSWATQDSMISEPVVQIQNPQTGRMHDTRIPLQSFIYFKGVL